MSIPHEIPDWLFDIKEDLGAIKAYTKTQGREIGELKSQVAGVKSQVDILVRDTAVLDSQIKSHIYDDGVHLHDGEMQRTIREEMDKYGLMRRPIEWISRHQVSAIGGLVTLVFIVLETLRRLGYL